MPYYSRIILNSFYNQLFPKLFRHSRRMPKCRIGTYVFGMRYIMFMYQIATTGNVCIRCMGPVNHLYNNYDGFIFSGWWHIASTPELKHIVKFTVLLAME